MQLIKQQPEKNFRREIFFRLFCYQLLKLIFFCGIRVLCAFLSKSALYSFFKHSIHVTEMRLTYYMSELYVDHHSEGVPT